MNHGLGISPPDVEHLQVFGLVNQVCAPADVSVTVAGMDFCAEHPVTYTKRSELHWKVESTHL